MLEQLAVTVMCSVFQEDKAGAKVEEYAETWLERIKHSRKHTTHDGYRKMLDRDILPALRGFNLKDISTRRLSPLLGVVILQCV